MFPAAGYRLAGLVGSMRHRLTRRWPTADEVRRLFGDLDAREASRVARAVTALYERNRVLVHSIRRHGIDPLRPLVSASESFRSLRGPLIIGMYHTGAMQGFGPALERLEAPVMAFRIDPIYTPGAGLTIESTKGDGQARALALHRALLHLQTGGVVFLALDVAPDVGLGVRCLGGTLRVAPGAFALARWSGAPIVPAVARWSGHRIEISTGDAISTPEDAALWLERYLLASPSEITLGLLRDLLGLTPGSGPSESRGDE